MDCPGFERLMDYLDSRMDEASNEIMEAHLAAGCEQCASNRKWYERISAIAVGDETVEPPAWALKRAMKLFDNSRPRERTPRLVARLVASLIFDSRSRPAMAGARLTEAADHQLLYHAEGYNIDLQIASSEGPTGDLTGQILREGEFAFESVAGLPLELECKGETVRSAATNEIGEFSFPALGQGKYDLRIETVEISITIVGLDIL